MRQMNIVNQEKHRPENACGKMAQTRELKALLKEGSKLEAGDERIYELAEQAISLAQTLGDPERLAQSSLLLASYYLVKYDYQKAASALEPFLEAFSDMPGHLKGQVLVSLTEAYRGLKEVSKVLRYGTEALNLYQARGDKLRQAQLHAHLGDACIRFAALHEALEHHLAQLELLKSCDAPLAEPYAGIGGVYMQLGDHENALSYLQKGLDKAREEGNEVLAGRCLGNLANVYDQLNEHAVAISYHQQAIDIFEARNDFRRAITGYSNLGRVYLEMGDSTRALAYFDKTLAQLKHTPSQASEGWVLIRIGEAYLSNDPVKAEKALLDGVAKLSEAGSNESIEHAHHLLYKLYEQQEKCDKALKHYKSYAEFHMQQLKDQNEKRTQALSIQFEVEQLQQAQEIYQLKNVELAKAVEKLEELSTRDSLTGLYNRRYLDTHLANVFLEARANQQDLSILISDIDNFKWVNDTFSHATGDEVLKIVAQHFSDHTWGADVVARYGGEEFVIVLKETPLEQARLVAEKLRQGVEAHPWHELHPGLIITLSTGLCADTSLNDYERMLSVADDNLYEAKRSGKNKVIS